MVTFLVLDGLSRLDEALDLTGSGLSSFKASRSASQHFNKRPFPFGVQ